MPDILSPRASNSIAAGEMADRQDVIRQCRAAARRCSWWIAAGVLLVALVGLTYAPAVCTENLNPGVMVMKPTKDGMRFDASCRLNRARDRRIFVQ